MSAIESLPLAVIVWLTFAMILSGFIQGALGFGFPFIATPMVAMLVDMRTAIITVLLPTLATVAITLFTSGPLGPTLKRFWPMPVYATLGALAGTWIFVSAPTAPYQLLLALIIIVYLNLDRFSRGEWPTTSTSHGWSGGPTRTCPPPSGKSTCGRRSRKTSPTINSCARFFRPTAPIRNIAPPQGSIWIAMANPVR